jgi:lipopolysaccharide/colanic/teichoic acid biosynthesis glycosyltransferase
MEKWDLKIIGRATRNISLYLSSVFNRILAILALLILSPLLFAISILILLDDGFPLFFVQTRIGENRKEFNLIKFRTMCRNAEARKKEVHNEASFPFFKNDKDPRITRIGRHLRVLSLDELP